MSKPNILMFHRINIDGRQEINSYYFQRNMVHHIDSVFDIIDSHLKSGCHFGSISQCLEDNKCFHLSFDDGFKEHIKVAKLIKEKYVIGYNHISFSINVGNSIFANYTGMDIVYQLLSFYNPNKLRELLEMDVDFNNVSEIKDKLLRRSPETLIKLSVKCDEIKERLRKTFLSKVEIIELSKIFQILSHGMTHRSLVYYKNESKDEIFQSKIILEKLIGRSINVFCYPEGKNDSDIQRNCIDAGYKYALSIRHEENNKYCIGRFVS